MATRDPSEPLPAPDPGLLAAIDIGSNSFHLLVAAVNHGELRPLEARGEKVQLAAGLCAGRLEPAAIRRGLEALSRFRQVLDTLRPDTVRVVGTNTLRAAKNAAEFITPAQELLGYPVEVVAGREEARLIYLGVAHSEADDNVARLVVDIGGGSTELIIGERFEPRLLESLHMGCVGYQQRFFPDGAITSERFERAYQAAYLELLNIREDFRAVGWSDCVGSSGTYLALADILRAQGWTSGAITGAGLRELRKLLIDRGHVERLDNIAGLKPARQGVIPAGTAIACAVVDALGIDAMRASPGALREGVIYDLIGRLHHEDVRERTVNALLKRSGLPELHARRVEQVAELLLAQVRATLGLGDRHRELLRWAARLHEIGLTIAHSQFHKHGQYIVQNADLPGFSQDEQRLLATLVRGHRRKFPRALIDGFPIAQRQVLTHLCVLLRLAVVFKYASPLDGMPPLEFAAAPGRYRLRFPDDWLRRHTLTAAELGQERAYLAEAGISLSFE
ncbi:MAG: HD domain-containing protein [Pseudomonadota bacterium]|jgi:exopolyphosphatase / guanosine-5'-triphosphate,3'-diphosphate pyrophosphatase